MDTTIEGTPVTRERPEKKIYTGTEDTEDTYRNRLTVQDIWTSMCYLGEPMPKEIRELDIDDHLTSLAEEAIKAGRKSLTILDIGSGPLGAFVFTFAQEKEYPKLHAFIKHNPGFNIRVLGITAAHGEQINGQLLKGDKIDFENKSKILIENYAYTVTRAGTIAKFLRDKLGENLSDTEYEERKKGGLIDVAFSTYGMGYFTPQNFNQALRDTVNSLYPNGTFFCSGYDIVPAGFELGSLLINRNPESFLTYARDVGFDMTKVKDLSPEKKSHVFASMCSYLLSRGIVDIPTIQGIIKDETKTDPFKSEEERENHIDKFNEVSKYFDGDTFSSIIKKLYSLAEGAIRERSSSKTTSAKLQAIDELADSPQFEVHYNQRALFVRRRRGNI